MQNRRAALPLLAAKPLANHAAPLGHHAMNVGQEVGLVPSCYIAPRRSPCREMFKTMASVYPASAHRATRRFQYSPRRIVAHLDPWPLRTLDATGIPQAIVQSQFGFQLPGVLHVSFVTLGLKNCRGVLGVPAAAACHCAHREVWPCIACTGQESGRYGSLGELKPESTLSGRASCAVLIDRFMIRFVL